MHQSTSPEDTYIPALQPGRSEAAAFLPYTEAIWRDRLAQAEERVRRAGVAAAVMERSGAQLAKRFSELTPSWLEEAQTAAATLSVPVERVLATNCPVPTGSTPEPGNCSGFVRVDDEGTALLKIRDERNLVQAAVVRRLNDGRTYQAGMDIGNLGIAHFASSTGLCGGNHTGSHTRHVSADGRFTDCHLLRYIAEHARRVEDVPPLFDALLARDAVGGAAATRGSIFVLADPRRGLILECHSSAYTYHYVDRGLTVVTNTFQLPESTSWSDGTVDVNSDTRHARLTKLLASFDNSPSPEQVRRITRDRANGPHALCNDDTEHFWMSISAWYQMLPREDAGRGVNVLCVGNPRNAFYAAVPLCTGESYLPYAAGHFYRAADALYQRHGAGDRLTARQQAVEAQTCTAPGNDSPTVAYRALLGDAANQAPTS
jgi:hypothetical protein